MSENELLVCVGLAVVASFAVTVGRTMITENRHRREIERHKGMAIRALKRQGGAE